MLPHLRNIEMQGIFICFLCKVTCNQSWPINSKPASSVVKLQHVPHSPADPILSASISSGNIWMEKMWNVTTRGVAVKHARALNQLQNSERVRATIISVSFIYCRSNSSYPKRQKRQFLFAPRWMRTGGTRVKDRSVHRCVWPSVLRWSCFGCVR